MVKIKHKIVFVAIICFILNCTTGFHFPGAAPPAKKQLEEATKNYDKKHFNVLVGYSGRREILSCLKRISSNNVDLEDISKSLWVSSNIDVVIRSGGNHRLSDCPLYQTHYAELFFLDKFFPEVNKKDLEDVVSSFSLTDRRFGK